MCGRCLGDVAAHDAGSWNCPGERWSKFDFHTHTPASTDYREPNYLAKGIIYREGNYNH